MDFKEIFVWSEIPNSWCRPPAFSSLILDQLYKKMGLTDMQISQYFLYIHATFVGSPYYDSNFCLAHLKMFSDFSDLKIYNSKQMST